jgi:hypothetical protein
VCGHTFVTEYILWHGSNAEFDTFSDAFLVRPESGPNSALGIWLGEEWVAANFGRFTYKVSCSLNKIFFMDIDDMVKHHNASGGDRSYFDAMRQNFLTEGYDAIFVREANGKCPTMVVLDMAALSVIERRTN